jgi:DNA-binding MarR family transcriptional regulator
MGTGELREILELMRLHQLRNRFVSTVSTGRLDTLQSYVLIELDINPGISIGELCSILRVDRNSVSRAIRSLEDGGSITGTANPNDRRRRVFSIRTSGREQLTFHEQNDREFLDRHLSSLSIAEVTELTQHYHSMSDAVGMPHIRIRKEEHPFIEPLRRLTRAYGFVGPSLFGSGSSSLQWHVLSAIQYAETTETLSSLAELLCLNVVTLSQRLKRYQSEGLLKSRVSTEDRRQRTLFLKARGKKRLEKIEGAGIELLKAAFDGRCTSDLTRFIEISRKYVGTSRSDRTTLLRPALHVTTLETDAERESARGFVLFHRTRLGLYRNIPERIVAADTITFVVREEGNLIALCEVALGEAQTNKDAEVLHFVYSAVAEQRQILPDFAAYIHTTLEAKHGVEVRFETLAEPTRDSLKRDKRQSLRQVP